MRKKAVQIKTELKALKRFFYLRSHLYLCPEKPFIDDLKSGEYWVVDLASNNLIPPESPNKQKGHQFFDTETHSKSNMVTQFGRVDSINKDTRVMEVTFLHTLTITSIYELPSFIHKSLAYDHPAFTWYSTQNQIIIIDESIQDPEPSISEPIIPDESSPPPATPPKATTPSIEENDEGFIPSFHRAKGFIVTYSVEGYEVDSKFARVVDLKENERKVGISYLKIQGPEILKSINPNELESVSEINWIPYDHPYIQWYSKEFELLTEYKGALPVFDQSSPIVSPFSSTDLGSLSNPITARDPDFRFSARREDSFEMGLNEKPLNTSNQIFRTDSLGEKPAFNQSKVSVSNVPKSKSPVRTLDLSLIQE